MYGGLSLENVNNTPKRSLARQICIEAFAEHGVKLSDDDSMIVAATVFTKALDHWKTNQEDIIAEEAAAFRRRLSGIMKEALELFRASMQKDVEAATLQAQIAVEKALAISDKGSHWRFWVQGAIFGIGVMLLLTLIVKLWL